MESLAEGWQTTGWTPEQHVPVISCPDTVRANQVFEVTVSLGREVDHPNTAAHHIDWVNLYFKPDGDAFTCQVAHFEISGNDEATTFAQDSPSYGSHTVTASMQTARSGTLYSVAFCNIHGLWEYSKRVTVSG